MRRLLVLALAALFSISTTSVVHAGTDEAAIVAKRPQKLLSQFGFFSDLAKQKPSKGVVPFDIATPLFTDHALKKRFVYVPAGQAATYNPREAFAFPVGTALIKTFYYSADLRRPDENIRLVETRLLLRQERGWQAWAYIWNEEQTDAVLNITGASFPVETVGLNGKPLGINYSVPNKNQCKGCHAKDGEIVPIGPKTRNLNKIYPYELGAENQLAFWQKTGILDNLPLLETVDAVPDWRDEAEPVNARARAWLDINCAHCHRPEGPASNSGLNLGWHVEDRVALGVGKRPVAAGRGSGGREFSILPGDPGGSIIVHRAASTEPGVMMPELGRSVADPDAVALLRRWIEEME
jgi:uncharacterized repeat protein (TIGR03806 family)